MNWIVAVAVVIGGLIWLEVFLLYPLYGIVLLVAIGGWWDYMRRRSKLRPR